MQSDMTQMGAVWLDDAGSNTIHPLSTLLPAFLQRRIPRIRRLRETFVQCQNTPCHIRASSYSSVASTTPPPSYRSSEIDPCLTASFPFPDGMPPSRPSSSGSATPSPPYREDSDSGINWQYAEPGFSLLCLAAQEDSALSRNRHMVRSQYLTGVTCMLRGLPADLSPEELASLREAGPPGLALFSASCAHDERHQQPAVTRQHDRSAEPSVLHRAVAAATLHIFLFVSFVLPYIQLLLKHAYRYDRKHRISDRVLAQSVRAADAMGKRTLTLAGNVCALKDGQVGEAMKLVGTYVMQGFGGGVYDGLGEGMQMIGLRASADASEPGSKRVKPRIMSM